MMRILRSGCIFTFVSSLLATLALTLPVSNNTTSSISIHPDNSNSTTLPVADTDASFSLPPPTPFSDIHCMGPAPYPGIVTSQACRLATSLFTADHPYKTEYTLTHRRRIITPSMLSCPATTAVENCEFVVDYRKRGGGWYDPPILAADIAEYGRRVARACVGGRRPDGQGGEIWSKGDGGRLIVRRAMLGEEWELDIKVRKKKPPGWEMDEEDREAGWGVELGAINNVTSVVEISR